MKYYVGKIDEQYGEFEVEQSILFATTENPSEILEEIAKDWYGQDEHDSDGLPDGMYWNCGEKAYGAGNYHEVSETTYAELKNKQVFVEMYSDGKPQWDRTPKPFDFRCIVRCENGVGEWEIHPTGETFDTRDEAEARLAEMLEAENE